MTGHPRKIGSYVVSDADGVPNHVLDLDQFEHRGKQLAYALAAVCDDPQALHDTLMSTVDEVGTEAFPYIAVYALKSMAEHVLLPVLLAASEHGPNLIAGIRSIADALNKEGG